MPKIIDTFWAIMAALVFIDLVATILLIHKLFGQGVIR